MNPDPLTPGDLTIANGLVFDPAVDSAPREVDIRVSQGRIVELVPRTGAGVSAPRPHPTTTIDADGALVLPGMVNAHYHSSDVLLKGSFEPSFLEHWMLEALPPRYGPRSLQEIYVRTLIGALEALSYGATTVQDMFGVFPPTTAVIDTVLRAYRDAGIRVVLAPQFLDMSILDSMPQWNDAIPAPLHHLLEPSSGADTSDWLTREEILDYVGQQSAREASDSLVTWGIAASGPERCSTHLLTELHGRARDLGLQFFAHTAISRAEAEAARQRFGKTSVHYLEELGLLGGGTTLSHCVWVDGDDVTRLAQSGTHVVNNPLSNLKTKNGIAPLAELYAQGAAMAIGCDNMSCSDTQNMFGAMKAHVLLGGLADTTGTAPRSLDALRAATGGGARAVGLADTVGTITIGAAADFVLIDLTDSAYQPLNDVARQLVFSESGRGVHSVIVGGEVVSRRGRSTRFSSSDIRGLLGDVMPTFRHDQARVAAEVALLYPHIEPVEQSLWSEGSADKRRMR